jgi:alkanesulfonate monooxygenase
MSNSAIRFGIWALVHGSRAALQDPDEPYDASWERNRSLVLKAEALGYDSTLVAQHTINPHSQALDQLEAWTASSGEARHETSTPAISASGRGHCHVPSRLADRKGGKLPV